ncbi:mitochondrial ribosomal protein L23 [Xylocopa sonorina]|uniref:mitochondrial ribosomal protein L23 n=1 Tax=Xylocopa sonorina TaxID=1818115 RepID=UPI00403B0F98
MSTRFYPLYQPGNPQLRVFLPNFWMKLVRPEHDQPKNVVQFHCSMEMTRYDVKNYLEKIYNVNPVHVRTRIALGKTRRIQKFIMKEDDVKVAYIVLPKNESFTFPDLLPAVATDEDKHKERIQELENNYKQFTKPSKVPGFPSWFRG